METIYIVAYDSYEGPDYYAFRNKDTAIKDIDVDFHNTISILKEQGYQFTVACDKPVSYTHLRAHETGQAIAYAVYCLKKFFFNDTATTEIYTIPASSAASDVYKRQNPIRETIFG